MWQYTYQDELYHFGVKGMKWGIRKAIEKAGRASLGIRYANALDRDQKIQRKQNKLQTKNTDKANARINKLQQKRDKLQTLMNRSVKSLTAKEIEQGKRQYDIGKKVAKNLLKIGVSALAGGLIGDIATNGGIRIAEDVVKTTLGRWSQLNGVGNNVVITEVSKSFVKIGRWAIEMPDSTKEHLSRAMITAVDATGKATEFIKK